MNGCQGLVPIFEPAVESGLELVGEGDRLRITDAPELMAPAGLKLLAVSLVLASCQLDRICDQERSTNAAVAPFA